MANSNPRDRNLSSGSERQPNGSSNRVGGDERTLRLVAISTLAIISVACWIFAHIDLPASSFIGLIGAISGIAVGVISPTSGAVLAIALVPYRGGAESIPFGLAEFLRGAPLWGATTRLLRDRFVAARMNLSVAQPPRLMTGAAILGMFIAPLQRITAAELGTFPSAGTPIDMLGILGSQSLFFATWIVAAHLHRRGVELLLRAATLTLSVALILSLVAWLGFSPIEFITFKANVFGRLATLGFPTPTAMGLAIAAPLVIATAFHYSRSAGIALSAGVVIAIILTESRGPAIALIAMLLLLIPSVKVLRGPRLIALLGGGGAAAFALLYNRYGSQVSDLLSGNVPNVEGDLQRITSWRAGIETALANPLTGGGWFSLRYWNDGELGKANVNLSHNIVLQGLSDGGFPLGLAAAVIVIGSVVLLLKNWRSIPLAWRLAAVAVVICGLWDMPQMRAFGALFAGAALGLVSRQPQSNQLTAEEHEQS